MKDHDEIVHHLEYNSTLSWKAVGDESVKYEQKRVKVIRRTHEDGRESFAFSFNWKDPDHSVYLFSIVLDIKNVVTVCPSVLEVSLKDVSVDASLHSVKISGLWVENSWEYAFKLEGVHRDDGKEKSF